MWAPTEMLGTVKERIRLKTISAPMPELHHEAPPRAQLHGGGAHQPEDRPRGAEAGGGGGDQRAAGAGEQRGEVDRGEPHRAERGLEHQAEQVQQVHVEADVQQVDVQERARHEAVVLVAFGDPGAVELAFVDDGAVDASAGDA